MFKRAVKSIVSLLVIAGIVVSLSFVDQKIGVQVTAGPIWYLHNLIWMAGGAVLFSFMKWFFKRKRRASVVRAAPGATVANMKIVT